MKFVTGGRVSVLLPDTSLKDVETGRESVTVGPPHRASEIHNSRSKPPGVYAATDVKLCSICQRIFYSNDQRVKSERVIDVHSVDDVHRAAGQGCGFCKVLKSALGRGYDEAALVSAQKAGSAFRGRRSSIRNFGNQLQVEWGDLDSGSGYRGLDILMIPDSDIPKLSKLSISPSRRWQAFSQLGTTDTSSPTTLSFARAWLQFCLAEHSLCGLSLTESRRLPTRLLEIDGDNVMLRNGKSLPVQTPYLTLSHCWGTGVTTRLLQDSPLLRGKNLTAASLSKTFHDAVKVSKSLGYRYLWIDSLCIIQDSDQDRREECSRMWEVYGNSHCTLAATASSGGDGGLFHAHNAGGPVPCKITPRSKYFKYYTDNDREEGKEAEATFHFLDDFELMNRIDDSPLCRRGWVAQERLLSPRILHFDSPQLWWECRELCASETYPEGLPKKLDGSVKQEWDPVSISHTSDIDRCYEAWSWCVEYFSHCHLSVPEDKLLAVAGVARQISKALENFGRPDAYLAGLWKSRMPLDLLWATVRDFFHRGFDQASNGHRSRQTKYRSPTWSWASINGAVELWKLDNQLTLQETELVEYNLSTSTDKFGAVSDGYIRLRGPLARVRLSEKMGQRSSSDVDDGDLINFPKTTFRLISTLGPEIDGHISFDDPEDYNFEGSMDIHFLIICKCRRKDQSTGYGYSSGLVLRHIVSVPGAAKDSGPQPKGVFRRLGMFYSQGDALDRYLAVTGGSTQHQDPDLMYEEDNGGGRYTIRVI